MSDSESDPRCECVRDAPACTVVGQLEEDEGSKGVAEVGEEEEVVDAGIVSEL